MKHLIQSTVSAATLLTLLLISGTASADIVLDGVYGPTDTYSDSQQISWFNGHKGEESIYGDDVETTIRYGEANGSFFLYVEAPLYAKNMIWQKLDWKRKYPLTNTNPTLGLTEEDVASYRVHHETHHKKGDMKLDFGGATGSEKMELFDGSGNLLFTASLAGKADQKFGLVENGFVDSVDYLFNNGLATEDLSLNRDTKMSFEFEFKGPAYSDLLGHLEDPNGDVSVAFHLSPERGDANVPVPEPATMAILALGGVAILKRRKRARI
jgi:hypothetical protein